MAGITGFVVVQWTTNAKARFAEHMCVNHCGRDVFMAKKLLNRADIVARLQQVCGKTVAKSVTTGGFAQAGSADRKLDRVLEILFRDVMTARLAAARVNAEFRGGADVLPWPGAHCIDVLSIKGRDADKRHHRRGRHPGDAIHVRA